MQKSKWHDIQINKENARYSNLSFLSSLFIWIFTVFSAFQIFFSHTFFISTTRAPLPCCIISRLPRVSFPQREEPAYPDVGLRDVFRVFTH
jgi:hypothetical protein